MALIEQEAAIALIEQKQKELCPVGRFSRNAVYGTDRDRFDAWDEIIDQINALPTIDAAPVVYGKWIDREGPDEDGNIIEWCSRCGHSDTHALTVDVPYCWFCGARMDGGEEHEAD